MQYNNDGTVDSAFGDKGKAQLFYSYQSSINSIALQIDGKIVAAGYCSPHFTKPLITRFHPDGRVDSSFGINGRATSVIINPALYTGGKASKVVVKFDGKIDIAGVTFMSPSQRPASKQKCLLVFHKVYFVSIFGQEERSDDQVSYSSERRGARRAEEESEPGQRKGKRDSKSAGAAGK